MQGVFLSTDDKQQKDDGQKNDDGQKKKSDEQKRTRDDEWLELDSNNSSSELGAEFTINRLNAISNVPWDEHLQPSNDRDTEKRMRQHREREIKYNTLDPLLGLSHCQLHQHIYLKYRQSYIGQFAED